MKLIGVDVSGNRKNSKALTTWASYVFVIAAIVITFSVAFAVGYVVNAIGIQKTSEIQNETAKILSPAVSFYVTIKIMLKIFSVINSTVNDRWQ